MESKVLKRRVGKYIEMSANLITRLVVILLGLVLAVGAITQKAIILGPSNPVVGYIMAGMAGALVGSLLRDLIRYVRRISKKESGRGTR